MVPTVAEKGTSFKGAGQYYLHDKQADTAERVVFTHTENLPTNNPEMAVRHMAYTAMHQDEIKAWAGVRAGGRKSALSVYSYSLSWAPDEQPTQEEMLAAGRESLKALGLEDHEVLMVAHDDEPHLHLHLIVNRVHPHTGIMAPLKNDYLTLSRWAEEYERRQGEIRCKQRPVNNELRRQGIFVKYRAGDPASFHRWRKMRGEQAHYVRKAEAANLSAYHRGQTQALYDEKERRITAAREDIKALNKPKWAALFRRQREEWKALNDAQRTAYSRLRYFVEHRGHDPRARTRTGLRQAVRESMRAVFGRDNPHGALSRKHVAERQALARETGQQTRSAMRHINKGYRRDLDQFRRHQSEEARALQEKHTRESQERAREIKEGRDYEQFRREAAPDLRAEFERRAWEKIREAKERREEAKRRGKDRDGGRERD